MQNILFRADSSSLIGTGHIMRDLVLAKQFEVSNIIFATQDLSGNINHKILEARFSLKTLASNDVNELSELLLKESIDMIVIDNYSIDYSFEKELKIKTNVKVFVFDDTYEKHYCDILLNHNIYAETSRYKGLVPSGCELRCGSKYTLLRDEFRVEKQNKKVLIKKEEPLKVFIAMGGADHSNINISILKVLEDFCNIHVNLVTTTSNQHLTELQKYTKDKEKITLHINTNKIAKLMAKSDFAIVTPSVTMNEAFYMNLPTIAIKTASNQNEMYNYLVKNKYFVLEKFNALELKSKLDELVDSLKITLVNFTDLSLDEKKMVLEWRNNQDIRKWMFNQNLIRLEEHLQYIKSLEVKEDRLYFLVKQGTHAIGVIDFTNIDIKNKSTEFGVYAKPNLRGKGSLLMNLIIDYAFDLLKVDTLISEVFQENKSAIKLYNKYNFKEVKRDEVLICMELKNEHR